LGLAWPDGCVSGPGRSTHCEATPQHVPPGIQTRQVSLLPVIARLTFSPLRQSLLCSSTRLYGVDYHYRPSYPSCPSYPSTAHYPASRCDVLH
jgi:hypothetical protein